MIPNSELDPRKQAILRAIVIEYVTQAEPIASESLLHKYAFGVSSATIRNEFSELSELGYLEKPHVSAGRIPSDQGYRFFVDSLVEPPEIGKPQRRHIEASVSESDGLVELLRETVSTLSHLTRLMSIAATLKDQHVTVRKMVFSGVSANQGLLILALSNGHVENKYVECPAGMTLEEIGRVNELLDEHTRGRPLSDPHLQKLHASGETPRVGHLIKLISSTLRTFVLNHMRGKLVSDGEEFLFQQPEFAKDQGSVSRLIERIDSGNDLVSTTSNEAEMITIGKEHQDPSLHQFTIIRKRFAVGDTPVGVISIIGPTRLNYREDIPLVDYTAQALTRTLTQKLD